MSLETGVRKVSGICSLVLILTPRSSRLHPLDDAVKTEPAGATLLTPLADSLNDAGALVAERRQQLARHVAAHDVVAAVTDARGADSDLHFACARGRQLHSLHAKALARLVQDGCFHAHDHARVRWAPAGAQISPSQSRSTAISCGRATSGSSSSGCQPFSHSTTSQPS